RLAELNLVSRLDVRRHDAAAVDPGAVARAEVSEQQPVRVALDLDVPAADGAVAQDEIVGGVATDADQPLERRDLLPLVGAGDDLEAPLADLHAAGVLLRHVHRLRRFRRGRGSAHRWRRNLRQTAQGGSIISTTSPDGFLTF